MSGIAIIIKGANFANSGYGTVTPVDDVPLNSISIVANDSYRGLSASLSVAYSPSNTDRKGVTWAITRGSAYASIDASTGLLTILEGASEASVTVTATSTIDQTISASKTIEVTYYDGINWFLKLTAAEEEAVINGYRSVTGPFKPIFFDDNSALAPLIAGQTINHIRLFGSGTVKIGKVDSSDAVIGAWEDIVFEETGVVETDLVRPITLGEGEYLALSGGGLLVKNNAHQYKGYNTKNNFVDSNACIALSVGFKE